jgi:hypothetical protein
MGGAEGGNAALRPHSSGVLSDVGVASARTARSLWTEPEFCR